ncbi:MAG TPA: RidA family protein [Steroidobacteraceae bacterium]|nr:RidA family protein [Steroidobacteraceae bacterium]
MARENFSSGSSWEPIVGYSRSVKVGDYLHVSGTASEGTGDLYQQTRQCLDKIDAALRAAGANLRQVVRTRIFTTDIGKWQEIGRAHGEVFKDIRPATTMVEVSKLIAPEILVEIEADAYLK